MSWRSSDMAVRPGCTIAVSWNLRWKGHACTLTIDGNKRGGFAALAAFLDVNGFTLTCTEAEETEAFLKVAAGEISEAEWSLWVEQVIALQ